MLTAYPRTKRLVTMTTIAVVAWISGWMAGRDYGVGKGFRQGVNAVIEELNHMAKSNRNAKR